MVAEPSSCHVGGRGFEPRRRREIFNTPQVASVKLFELQIHLRLHGSLLASARLDEVTELCEAYRSVLVYGYTEFGLLKEL